MMKTSSKFFACIIALCAGAALFFSTVSRASVDDLFSDDAEAYGSEKEEKFPINAFFVEREKWEGHSGVNFFFFLRYKDYPKYEYFRLFPFYFHVKSKVDDRERRIIFPLYFSETENGNYFNIHPFGFYSSTSYSYDYSLLYLFYIGQNNYSEGSFHHYTSVIPLFYRGRSHDSSLKSDEYSFHTLLGGWYDRTNQYGKYSFNYTPLFFSSSETRTYQNGSESVTRKFGFPIIPFLFYVRRENGHVASMNFLSLFYVKYDAEGKNPEWIVNPFYIGYQSSTEKIGASIPFLAFRMKNSHETLAFSPFGFYYGDNRTQEEVSGFPVIPFIAYNKKNSSVANHYLFSGLINWETDVKKDTVTQFFSPLFFFGDGYKAFLPFYLYRSRENFSSLWTPLFYYSKDDTERYFHLFWLYYSRTSEKNGSYNTLFPLYYYSSIDGLTRFMTPLSYYSNDEEARYMHFFWLYYSVNYHQSGYYRKMLFPLYYSWKDEKSTGSLCLPLWFQYKSKDDYFYLNLLGVSRSVAAGTSPLLDASIGRINGVWYVDTDFSWLYTMFRISKRIPLSKPADVTEGNFDEGNSIPASESENIARSEPRFSEKAEPFDRSSSLNYFSFTSLFGLLRYESADDMRHFRFFPLWWLTWNKQSDDKVYVVPGAFINYHYLDKRYFVLFPLFVPLYGRAEDSTSFVDAWCLNLFWREKDKTTGAREYSVLWPFINYYSRPNSYGYRFFPFFWRKYDKNELAERYRTVFFPLLYRDARYVDEKQISLFQISPLGFSAMEKKDDVVSGREFYPILPLYYHSYRYDGAVRYDYRRILGIIKIESFSGGSSFSLFPLIFSTEDSSRRTFAVLPLLFYRSTDKTLNRTSTVLGPYWGTTETNGSTQRILPLFYHWNYGDKDNGTAFFPFFWKSRNQNSSYFHVFPLLFWSWDHGTDEHGWLLATIWKSRNGDSSYFHFMPFIFTASNSSGSSGFVFGYYYNRENQSETLSYARDNFLYLADYRRDYRNDERDLSFLFGSLSYERRRDSYKFSALYSLLFKYESGKDFYDFDYLCYLGSFEKRGDSLYHSSLLPIWWYTRRDDTLKLMLTPMFYHYHSSDESFSMLGLGALWFNYRRKDYERNMLLLGSLYSHYRDDSMRGYEFRGSLWGFLWEYETEKETDYSKFSLLKILYKKVHFEERDYVRILGIKIFESKRDSESVNEQGVSNVEVVSERKRSTRYMFDAI